MLTLGQAARVTGTSKTTLTRAIRGGKLSAERREDGSYAIDNSELARVFNVTLQTSDAPGTSVHRVTPKNDHETPNLAGRLAAAEADNHGLRAMIEELRSSRDAWQAQAERATLALAAPKPERADVITPPPPPTAPAEFRRPSWWRRLVG